MRALVFAVVVLGSQVAYADEPMYACHTLPATTKISVTFKPETPLADLATWVMGFTCKNIVFSTDVAKHATRVTILAPKDMTPKQAMQLFVDAVEATGLVVVQKPDTIIIKLGPNMPASCPDVATASPPPPAQDDDELGKALDAGIKKIDDTHYQISRAVVDLVLSNPMAVAKGARVVPAMKDGKPSGFKLYAIRPSSIWARVGLMNGDTLVAINGFDLTSADKALEVYTKLRDAKTLVVDLERRGQPLTLNIAIR
jgi:general secretion pathway protein C